MNTNLEEIIELLRQAENRSRKQKPEISVTIKTGEEENFLVMHIDEDYGVVVGRLGATELIRAIDMLIDSIIEVIIRMPLHEQIILLDYIKERVK